ncbi:unnamed protein product [Scytosiphon promiscuus]
MLPNRPAPSAAAKSSPTAPTAPAGSAATAAAIAIAASFLNPTPMDGAEISGTAAAAGSQARESGGGELSRAEGRPAARAEGAPFSAGGPPGDPRLDRVNSSNLSMTGGSQQVHRARGAAGTVEATVRAGDRDSVGGPVGGHYGPLVGSAAEIEKADREMALKRRRAAEMLLAASGGAGPAAEEKVNPVQRIMEKYAGTGPYRLLYRLHEENRRASVMIRRVNSVRGTCTGLIRAFDRHMNLLLVDVHDPARDDGRRDGGGSGDDKDDPRSPFNPPRSSAEAPLRSERATTPREPAGGAQGMDVEGAQDSAGTTVAFRSVAADAAAAALGVRGEGGGDSSGRDAVGGDERRREEGRAASAATAARKGAGRPVPSPRAVDGGKASGFGVRHDSSGGAIASHNAGEDAGQSRLRHPARGGLEATSVSGVPPAAGVEAPGQGESMDYRSRGREDQHGDSTRKVYLAQEWGMDNASTTKAGAGPPSGCGRGRSEGTKQQPAVEGTARCDDEEREDLRKDCRTDLETGKKTKSSRRHRGRGPWTGKLMPVRRQRFLKQVLIRGDNVVMIWEAPKS